MRSIDAEDTSAHQCTQSNNTYFYKTLCSTDDVLENIATRLKQIRKLYTDSEAVLKDVETTEEISQINDDLEKKLAENIDELTGQINTYLKMCSDEYDMVTDQVTCLLKHDEIN